MYGIFYFGFCAPVLGPFRQVTAPGRQHRRPYKLIPVIGFVLISRTQPLDSVLELIT